MEPSAVAGGEVRRVHVVYFLCRSGVVEQPHLIRVHHLQRHGVHLRDVKRWLSELRGKDMPESFSWSYKRRYKAGYVWQDLTEDDLITPISDNEYVLKGSDLADNHNNPLSDTFTPGRITPERACLHFEPKLDAGFDLISPPETLHIDRDDNISPKPPPRLDNDSPGGNSTPPPSTTLHQLPMSPLPTLRDHFGLEYTGALPPPPATPPPPPPPAKQIAVLEIDTWRQHEKVEVEKKQRQEHEGGGGGRGSVDGGKGGGRHSFYIGSGRRASHGLYDLLRCRAVETDDSVRFTGDRRDRDCLAGGRAGFSHKTFDGSSTQPSIHSPSSRRKSHSTNGEKSPRMAGERPVPAVYKPVGEPNCSHCGKAFNPEKFHAHMKSCSVLRRSRKD